MVAHVHPVPLEWGRLLIDSSLAACGMKGMPRDYWPSEPRGRAAETRARMSGVRPDPDLPSLEGDPR